MIDSENQDVLTIGKLVIYRNTLIYENSIIQISNICSIWVADHSYVVKNKVPAWIAVVGFIGVFCISFGIYDGGFVFSVAGVALVIGTVLGFLKHKPTTPISKYALGVERSSGRTMLFKASDKAFVKKMAKALMEVMSEKKNTSEMVVMNFDNKSINIENVEGSNIIGGNVSDSLVESL
ncbi:hypothetical protein A9Q81_26630 [Gammaproteobacteria bacterium 42_54_T18]|nr:hypothetical protein A9Q81_26630 [Gammaproteobacteria bacterium 42_54_T18]